MIYPDNFEEKIGFTSIRESLLEKCMSTLGEEEVEQIAFSTDAASINAQLKAVEEFNMLLTTYPDFPLRYFFDVRPVLHRLRLEGTHAEEAELHDLRRSLSTACRAAEMMKKRQAEDVSEFPFLAALVDETIEGMTLREFTSPLINIIKDIDRILDEHGLMRDSASKKLSDTREEKRKREKSLARTLYNILSAAQNEGLISKDVAPTLRDSRLVLPIAPQMKRRIPGIIHDESASGRTVYVEPTEVVEANNRIRELEIEERREIIKILTEFANVLRPLVAHALLAYRLLAKTDLIYAKCQFKEQTKGTAPHVYSRPFVDWIRARHPLLEASLERQGKRQVPLDIMLTPEKRLLIISGPNAGGKSVCMKTVGLLQYMLQCGLPIPVDERSKAGVFKRIMLDMGDEQSIDDDLSTYSGHLINMKQMVRGADKTTLLLIDEFGGGTEPTIGGAIAEAVLKQFWTQKAWGVITTHYQNLKHFADSHDGIVNAAMLYDRHEMRPLFVLEIGRPGSSFAIEIARKIGLPANVIEEATEIVGQELIDSDKYLQDIVRDKRYWENKRQTIHRREKDIEKTINRFESEVSDIESSRKDILRRAKEQAEELLKEANRKIENTIRDIRQQQAEREATRKLREELDSFKAEIADIDTRQTDEIIEKKIRQIQQRRQRKEERRSKRQKENITPTDKQPEAALTNDGNSKPRDNSSTTETVFVVGQNVRIRGLTTIGQIEKTDGKTAVVMFDSVRTKMPLERLELITDIKKQSATPSYSIVNNPLSRTTRETIDQRRNAFKPEIDIRGMRGDEALSAVTYFIDDAVLVGVAQVRILHGTGNGILRQLIRQYLTTLPYIEAVRDEHVQFGGAGITVVKFSQ